MYLGNLVKKTKKKKQYKDTTAVPVWPVFKRSRSE